jgi:hypothetical protein
MPAGVGRSSFVRGALIAFTDLPDFASAFRADFTHVAVDERASPAGDE